MVTYPKLILEICLMMLLSAAVAGQTTSTGSGQAYPHKPIRIVTGAPGGNTDIVPRIIAQGISGALGQQVIIDNRGGIIPIEIVSKAPPDGYTLLLSASTFYVSPLTQKMPYDPVKDFAPLTMVGSAPLVIFVTASLQVKSVKELIAYGKSKPGELNYSIGGLGGAGHLAAELFNSMAASR